MANALSEGVVGFIVIGVEDAKAGGAVLGISKAPSADTVAQVLTSYTNPVPSINILNVILDGKAVQVIEVLWTPSHPYYSVRDVDGTLASDAVYIRRGATVSR